ncbi:IspD/TarI family cytidylyltransferase [Actinomadura sp. DC4]|uniref:IspD/TarI family cytidylyltransferase n=1 Tax=Actinomadura sp. DC4 TaxID=3055069 RepID=UPI0025B068EC|nr:IspD/TarI family cytidylyltransferase [Actinomadura sp. DC4]MDN3355478.1 IspD/TarI family cytidylyltransferase [Actinomadura sp. DC4]
MSTTAVVLAGGTGRRLGLEGPKQLASVGGRPILSRAIGAFDAAPEIDDILVVMAPGHRAAAELAARPYAKVTGVIEGGASRTDSTLCALSALAGLPGRTRVLFHDAARPFVDGRIIAECAAALETAEAVAVAVPSSDTVVVVEDGRVVEMPRRDSLRRFQTPQGFRLSTIRTAYERALADPEFAGTPPTDDCGVVHRYLPEVPIVVVPGSERNIKITHPVDLIVAEQITAGEEDAPGSAG